jgi:Acyl-CoA carboxylase epsilon subunit
MAGEPDETRADEIRVTRGLPTDSELAAIVGVLFLRRAPAPAAEVEPEINRWTASARPGYAYRDGRPAQPSATGWVSSTLPR